jgi:hypothetical protein
LTVTAHRRLTRPASAPFRAGAAAPIRPVIRARLAEEPASSSPVSRRLSATGIRFSGHPAPAERSASLTVGPPAPATPAWASTGLSRSARDRYDRGGCPLCPGGGGALPPGQVPPGGTRRLTATGPYLPLNNPSSGSADDETSTRVHAIHPSGLPQPVAPGWNGSPWAFPWASHPAVTRDARRGGDGPCALDRALRLRHQSNLL